MSTGVCRAVSAMSHEEIVRAFQQMRQNVGNTAEQLHELQSQARSKSFDAGCCTVETQILGCKLCAA